MHAAKSAPSQQQWRSVLHPHASLNARVDKVARYQQLAVDDLVGKTVVVNAGTYRGLTGTVVGSTRIGDMVKVQVQLANRIVDIGVGLLDVVHALPATGTPPLGAEAQAAAQLPKAPLTKVHPHPLRASPSHRSAEPKLYSIARPEPTSRYMAGAYTQPAVLDISRPLLIILDLNGTLLYRKNKGFNFKPRPHLDEFLEYLFSNHVVMVWSSANAHNVVRMCQKLFNPEQLKSVAAIWTRDNLRLTPEQHASNTQVYKRLSWVWQDRGIQAKNPVKNSHWDQSNTILLDDSVEKSSSEPFNLVRIDEFEDRPDQAKEDVLPQVAIYLNTLRSQLDVSSYIRSQPFVHDPAMPRAAAEASALSRHLA